MDKTQAILEVLEKYGLGVTLSLIIVFLLYFILRNLIRSFNDIIQRQNTVIDNHLQHLEDSVNKSGTKIDIMGEKFTSGIEKICDSIESQTNIMREMLSDKGDRHG